MVLLLFGKWVIKVEVQKLKGPSEKGVHLRDRILSSMGLLISMPCRHGGGAVTRRFDTFSIGKITAFAVSFNVLRVSRHCCW